MKRRRGREKPKGWENERGREEGEITFCCYCSVELLVITLVMINIIVIILSLYSLSLLISIL